MPKDDAPVALSLLDLHAEVELSRHVERLECSGIAEGQESATSRLQRKVAQLARFPGQPSGHAVVTNFKMEPVEIRVGSFPR